MSPQNEMLSDTQLQSPHFSPLLTKHPEAVRASQRKHWGSVWQFGSCLVPPSSALFCWGIVTLGNITST